MDESADRPACTPYVHREFWTYFWGPVKYGTTRPLMLNNWWFIRDQLFTIKGLILFSDRNKDDGQGGWRICCTKFKLLIENLWCETTNKNIELIILSKCYE